jgi:hypothetical protein
MSRAQIDKGQAAYDATRARLVQEYDRLIAAQRDAIASLEGEPARILDALIAEKKRQARREELLRQAEARLTRAAAEGAADLQKLADKQADARRRSEKGAAKLARLEERRAAIPAIERREAAARETLAALLERREDGDHLHEVSEAARERAIAAALEDAEAEANIARRNKARKIHSDRDRPTAEQIARRGIAGTTREGAFRLNADLPDAILRMKRAGFPFEPGELEAAGRYREDYLFGCERAKLVSSYEVGVQGGAGAQDIKESKLDTFERYRAASAAIPAQARTVLEAVLINDCDLASAGGLANRYAGEKARRSANGVLLTLALGELKAFYSSG